MVEHFTTYYRWPLGIFKISSDGSYITELLFHADDAKGAALSDSQQDLPPVLLQCMRELTEYFEGSRKSFDVPVIQEGSDFQKRVWSALQEIPYGRTISYLELSRRIGDVKAIRAAASTNGKNKIAVIVPCHRVIGSNNDLVGYAGGLSNKRWLLQHEAKIAHGLQTLF